MMKKIGVLLIVMCAFIGNTIAQSKYGETPEDSTECVKSLIYKEYLKNDTKLALELWRKAIAICPGSQKSLYINGVKLYTGLYKQALSDSMKKTYKDTIIQLLDQRIKYFGEEGKVQGIKAQTLLSFKPKKKDELLEIANILEGAIKKMGNKTDPGSLIAAMFVTVQLQKNKIISTDSLVTKYQQLIEICDNNIAKGGKRVNYYKGVQTKINNMSSKYLSCETIVEIAESKYEENQENTAWLKRMSLLLQYKKCIKAPIFIQISEAYFKYSPTIDAAFNLSMLYTAKSNYDKAIVFIDKAIEMDTIPEDKAKHLYDKARIYLIQGSYIKSRSAARQSLAIKKWSDPYIIIGDGYAASYAKCDDKKLGKWAAYWSAEDKYIKALSLSSEEEKMGINKKIAQIRKRYPTQKDIFFFGKSAGEKIETGCWIGEKTTIRINP